jgi:hypothetical protein
MNIAPLASKAALAVAGLVLTGALAHAQLVLTGTTYGTFSDPVGGTTNMITNGDPVSTYKTGVPYKSSPHTTVNFNGSYGSNEFDLLGDGDQDNFGKISITNGTDLIGTDSTGVTMGVYLDFTDIPLSNFLLTTLQFTFVNTPDGSTPGGVPDIYSISYTPLGSFVYDGVAVSFTLLNPGDPNSFFNPGGRAIAEQHLGSENLLVEVNETVLTPVPEPMTYALWGCALLAGLVALRFRSSGTSGPALAV